MRQVVHPHLRAFSEKTWNRSLALIPWPMLRTEASLDPRKGDLSYPASIASVEPARACEFDIVVMFMMPDEDRRVMRAGANHPEAEARSRAQETGIS